METCQWHLQDVGNEKCSELSEHSTTNRRTLEILCFCSKHFEELVSMGKASKPKEWKDMSVEEFTTMVLRRQYFGPFMKKIHDIYEDHQIYQILLEELALLGPKLPRDKLEYAWSQATGSVGWEAAALQKKLKGI